MMLKKGSLSVETCATHSSSLRSSCYHCIRWMNTLMGPEIPGQVPEQPRCSDFSGCFSQSLERSQAQNDDFFDQWWKKRETFYLGSPEGDDCIKSLGLRLGIVGPVKNAESLGKRPFLGFILNSNKSAEKEMTSEEKCSPFNWRRPATWTRVTEDSQSIPIFDLSKKKVARALPGLEVEAKLERRGAGKLQRLKHLFTVMLQFYNAKALSRSCFDRLSLVEQKVLFFLLKKLFPSKVLQEPPSFAQLEALKSRPSKKRNEEKIKQIWKRFLRKIYDDFKLRFAQTEGDGARKGKACDKWREFYAHIFEDLVAREGGRYCFDLVMDICTERTIRLVNSKQPKRLGRANNWKSLAKISAMKKIPASFRFLVSQSQTYSKVFREFLARENSGGIMALMTKIILNKLQNLFCQWEAKLGKAGDAAFLATVEKQIRNKKFKLPWLLSNVKDSIDYCLRDLGNAKLSKKFESIRQNHYTFKGNSVSKNK